MDGMSDDEMVGAVRSWLDQKGYVLEMEVAQQFLPTVPA